MSCEIPWDSLKCEISSTRWSTSFLKTRLNQLLVPRSLLLGCLRNRVVLCDAHSTPRHGRVLVRSRFRGPAGCERAREHAFQHLELADPAPQDESPEVECEEVPCVLEICAELLSVDAWRLVDYGHFLRDEDILPLDARSAL